MSCDVLINKNEQQNFDLNLTCEKKNSLFFQIAQINLSQERIIRNSQKLKKYIGDFQKKKKSKKVNKQKENK